MADKIKVFVPSYQPYGSPIYIEYEWDALKPQLNLYSEVCYYCEKCDLIVMYEIYKERFMCSECFQERYVVENG